METQRRQWFMYKCFNIANQVTILFSWSTYKHILINMLWLSVCFSTTNMFQWKQKSEKSLIQTKETSWIIPHFSSWGRTENLDNGKFEGNEKTYVCKVWCSHCAKCEAQISSRLRVHGKREWRHLLKKQLYSVNFR